VSLKSVVIEGFSTKGGETMRSLVNFFSGLRISTLNPLMAMVLVFAVVVGMAGQANAQTSRYTPRIALTASPYSLNVPSTVGGVDPLWMVNDEGNPALRLDGKDDWVELTDFVVPEIFTVEMWINPNSTRDGQCFIGKHTIDGGNIFLVGYWSGALHVRIRSDTHQEGDKITGFHHLAVVVEKATSSSSDVTVYRNGDLLWQKTLADTIGDPTGKPWVLGQDWDGESLSDFFNGIVDEIRVWDAARTQEQIQATMDTKLTGSEPGLIGYWNFDDGTVIDLSPNGNDGTRNGGACIIYPDRLYQVYQGVCFPDGERSFADVVVSYDPVMNGEPRAKNMVKSNALGIPNDISVSLGVGGSITLQFTDNSMTGSGDDTADLWIFEIGPDVEDTFVEISQDGVEWLSVGKVFGSTSGIDLDAFDFGPTDAFSYVRLTDDPDEGDQTGGGSVGADIDAVGAISSGSAVEIPLTMSNLNPSSGPDVGGTAITITGTGFQSGTTVKIDGKDAIDVKVVSATEITAVTPAGSEGTAGLVVTNPDGKSATLKDGYTYMATPAAPTGLVAVAYVDSVRLDWNANTEPNLHAYYIYRDTSSLACTLLDSVVAQSPPDTFYVDRNVVNGTTYYYRITAVDSAGNESGYSNEESVTPFVPVNIELSAQGVSWVPTAYRLSENYPNPFNPSTTIRYQLPEPGHVRLTIYDLLGQEVRVLVSERQPAGWYVVTWDGRDKAERWVSSGVYLYRLEVGADFVQTRKALLLR